MTEGDRPHLCKLHPHGISLNELVVGTTPPPPTNILISSSFHRLDMTLAVAKALNPNNTKNQKPIFTKIINATNNRGSVGCTHHFVECLWRLCRPTVPVIGLTADPVIWDVKRGLVRNIGLYKTAGSIFDLFWSNMIAL